jgi:NAD(P)-dependent dehydrogenase (short-subunit alcohol dehydrogenase family)
MTTVVISGCSRGLGLALAQNYLAAGADVIGGCRKTGAASGLSDSGAEVLELDTGSGESIALFAAAIGDRPVDVLFNNAGIDARAVGAEEASRGALDLTEEQFREVFEVNLIGPMLMVKALADNLCATGGTVVNVTSQVGSLEVAQQIGSDAAYTSSKAALNMLSVKQSQALRPRGVSVIALHPGWLRSDMGGPRATLEVADAAASIVQLVDGLTLEQSGSFLRWDGSVHPW